MRLKGINIRNKELQGKTIIFKALVISTKKAKARNGNDYLTIEVVDQGVKETIRIFNLNNVNIKEGRVYEFRCTIGEYNGNAQLNYEDNRITQEEPTDYLNRVENISYYTDFIGYSIEYMQEPLKTVTRNLYVKYQEQFSVYPAARSMHHNLTGGLAMHTGTMLMNAQDLQRRYPHTNLSLINAIIILHDMGKIREYDVNVSGAVEYSVEGSMLGHISLILGEIEVECSKLTNLTLKDESLLLALKNGVASHHGRLEWGSPVKPATAEARLVHYLDMIDAEMYKANRELSKLNHLEIAVDFNNRPDIETYYKL